MLTEAQCQSIQAVAGFCAYHGLYRTPNLTLEDRFDAALSGIVDEVAEYGWPDGSVSRLFDAGDRRIAGEQYERHKHPRSGERWLPTRGGIDDPVADAVIEKIAVMQLCWAFSDDEWEAVWALAEATRKGGGWRQAADMLGLERAAFMGRLGRARKRARELWVAPGEHVSGHHMPAHRNNRGKLATWKKNKTTRGRREAAA